MTSWNESRAVVGYSAVTGSALSGRGEPVRRRASRRVLVLAYLLVIGACLSGWALALYTVYTLA